MMRATACALLLALCGGLRLREGEQSQESADIEQETVFFPRNVTFKWSWGSTTTIPPPTPAPPRGPMRRPYSCEDIKDKFTCLRSKYMFDLDCIGYGGEWCIPALGAKCSDIANPVTCNKAKRLGMGCVGWTGYACVR